MRLAIVGVGHVGLVTAAAMAELGHAVVATDTDRAKLALLTAGEIPFYEPGLDELLRKAQESDRLRFVDEVAAAVSDVKAVFVCVGRLSPEGEDRSLAAVEAVVRGIAPHIPEGILVIEKSTVPPGTAERIRATILRERPELDFEVVANPEFLREGQGVRDSLDPERIVVGASSGRAFELMREIYEPLLARGVRVIETDLRTAELAKLACNAFLATKISYINGLARLCEATGADVVDIAEVMGSDSRIGPAFLAAGLGYGGYCLPKDVGMLRSVADHHGSDFGLLREVARINDEAVDAVITKVHESVWNLEGKRVALLGLAFKGGTDDVRGAPALVLARKLLAEGADLVAYDPEAAGPAKEVMPELEIAPDALAAADGADCVVICTDWDEFRRLDLDRLRTEMSTPIVIDGRNLLRPEDVEAAGLSYLPTGRPSHSRNPQWT